MIKFKHPQPMKQIIPFLFLAIVICGSCTKTQGIPQQQQTAKAAPDTCAEFVSFGRSIMNRSCSQDICHEMYRLCASGLYENTKLIPYLEHPFNDYVKLDTLKYNSVKNFANIIPAQLTASAPGKFGSPICADCEKIYFISVRQNNQQKSWTVIKDMYNTGVPVYILPLLDSIDVYIGIAQ
jgi:hypothetical protein